jgi:hypothetical protein
LFGSTLHELPQKKEIRRSISIHQKIQTRNIPNEVPKTEFTV